MSLYDALRLYISKDAYTLIPESGGPLTKAVPSPSHLASADGRGTSADQHGLPASLVFDRRTNQIVVSSALTPPIAYDTAILVYGLFGIVSLYNSDYLIFITSRKRVARILDSDIYLARDFKVFPIDPSLSAQATGYIAGIHRPNETFLLSLIKGHLYSGPFYYTYGGYDIITRLQSQDPKDTRPLYQKADDRFFWNRYLQTRLIDLADTQGQFNVSAFVLPVLFGFCEFKTASIRGRDFVFGVVSRRSRFRAGTRYFSRGIDVNGHVSNFNETEQIVLLDPLDDKSVPRPVRGLVQASFVQIRGSVPIYWAEVNNLRYKPDLVVMDLTTTTESLQRHFDSIKSVYGDIYVVNLVNQKGYEKPVKEAFERALQELGDSQVHYTYFDFHHETKGLRFERVSLLIDQFQPALVQHGYFYSDASAQQNQAQRKQNSAIRTNCMDSLDRTNVVQSTFGKWALNEQLRHAGVLTLNESIEQHPDFMFLFRNVWADNADTISKAYSGTGALKTDYTRTGKRTNEGLLQDGVNSIMRYVKNNFLDGPRQDAYDLVTGTWVPKKGEAQQFIDQRPILTRLAPHIFLTSLVVFATMLMLPAFTANYLNMGRKVAVVDMLAFTASGYYLIAHGVDYVAWPRLSPLTDTINYSGKGYFSGKRGRGFAGSHASHMGGKHKQLAVASHNEKGERDVEIAHQSVAGKKRVD